MRTILVVNPKGGCGKTTIATNLAGYYASKGVECTLVDLDQQKSSLQWVKSRPDDQPQINISTDIEAEHEGKRVIYDCPAQIHLGLTTDLINRSDVIIMPINPSVIDHRAAFKFIFDVRGMIRANVCKHIKIGMVANRANPTFNSYQELEKFADLMQTPIVTSLRTSQNYVLAAERGLSIFELPNHKVATDKEQWKSLSYWAEGKLLRKKSGDRSRLSTASHAHVSV